jgi:integrase
MSIYWEKSKRRWRFDYQGTVAGRRIRARKLLPTGWSKAQALEYQQAEIKRLFEVGEQPEPTIDACVLLYLQDKEHLKSRGKVIEHLAAIQSHYEGRPLSELTVVAREISTARGDKELAPATIKQRLALLKAACRWAWKIHGVCENDPTTKMLLPSVRNARHVYASRAEMLHIARACDRPDARAMVLVAFYTGMRLGEMLCCSVVGENLSLPDTKNGQPRLVPIHSSIRRYARHLPFTTPKVTLQRAFDRARRRAGLSHVRIHDLRHSAASEMINAGVDLYTVGAVLGHKDSRSTQRYAHLATATLADAVRRIGKSSPTAKKKAA